MIYDSIRQAKPAIRNNFGAGRLNTRLNFYFFEINRLSFIQQKSFYSKRHYHYNSYKSQKDFLLYINIGTSDAAVERLGDHQVLW